LRSDRRRIGTGYTTSARTEHLRMLRRRPALEAPGMTWVLPSLTTTTMDMKTYMSPGTEEIIFITTTETAPSRMLRSAPALVAITRRDRTGIRARRGWIWTTMGCSIW